ncbi:hypothetical protein BLOT_010754 [Blomia tropicalis]|nr:hypothetical protein BLOT_010754 [Blomia tropicalis]
MYNGYERANPLTSWRNNLTFQRTGLQTVSELIHRHYIALRCLVVEAGRFIYFGSYDGPTDRPTDRPTERGQIVDKSTMESYVEKSALLSE